MRTSVDRVVLGVFVVIVAIVVAGCNRSTTLRVSFSVEGMHCESCSSAITEALEKVDGVDSASADHATGSADASFVSPGVSPEQLVAEIEGLGYTVTDVKTIPIEG